MGAVNFLCLLFGLEPKTEAAVILDQHTAHCRPKKKTHSEIRDSHSCGRRLQGKSYVFPTGVSVLVSQQDVHEPTDVSISIVTSPFLNKVKE